MADYHQLKNAAILTPTTGTDLGSDSNRYSNVFMSGNIVMSNGVTVTSTNVITPKIASVTYPGDDTAANIAGGQTLTITGTGFSSGASVLIGTTPATVVTVVSSTSITFTSPALSAGNYALYVINSDGGTAIYIPGIAFSPTPVWVTSSGNLATVYETNSISSTLSTSGDTPITYSLNSGTLPTGSTLNGSSGLISGTAPTSAGSTTYSFVIRATDGQNQDTDRSFTITVNTDAVTWVSPADNTATALIQGSAMSNVTLNASAASGQSVTYTANALPTGLSISGANVIGTPTVLGSTTSLITATAASSGRTATRTLSWEVSVGSETYWPYVTLLLNGEGTAATNNAQNNTYVDSSTNAYAVTTSGTPVQGSFSPFSATSWSNYFDGVGDYLTLAYSSAFDVGSNNASVECWINFTTAPVTQIINGQNSGSGSTMRMGVWGSTFRYTINDDTLRDTTITPVVGTWYHLCLTITGGVARFFINGVLRKTDSGLGNVSNRAEVYAIGTEETSAVNGYISNFRFSNGSIPTSYQTSSTTVGATIFTVPTASLTTTSQGATSSHVKILTCQSNRFVDNSATATVISRYGDTSVTKFTPFNGTNSYDPATYGGSVYLDGSTSLQIASGSLLNVSASTNWTLECWVYFTTVGGGYQHLFFGSGISFGLYGATCYGTNNSAGLINGGTAVAGQWTHVALVNIASTSYKIYVNGVEFATGGASSFSASNTYLGANGTTQGITGYMSNMRIVRGTAVYTGSFNPPTAPLTAIANTALLVSATNAGVIDQTGINNLRTLGDAKISTAVKKYNSGSISFDGSGDYLSVGTTGSPFFSLNSSRYTIEFWVYFNSLAGEQVIVERFTAGSGPGYTLYKTGSNTINLYGSGSVITNTTVFTTSTWYHIAVTYDGTNTRIFVNGTLEATAAATVTDGGTTLIVGSRTGGSAFFNGYIDDLRITKGFARYTSNFTAPTSALITR
jgi:hypothetical protein